MNDVSAPPFVYAFGASPCGGLRTLEILAPLEKETRVPVVSSLPHALWSGMRLLGLKVKAPGYGRLLANG